MSRTTATGTASNPSRQRGSTSAGGGDGGPAHPVAPPARGAPQRHRIAQRLVVDARGAVDRAEELHEVVRRDRPSALARRALARAERAEALLDVGPGNAVETALEPVRHMGMQPLEIFGPRLGRERRPGCEVALEGAPKRGNRRL